MRNQEVHLRRSCRQSTSAHLKSTLITTDEFLNDVNNDSEDSVPRRPEKRRRKNNPIQQQHIPTTDSTPSPVPCSGVNSEDNTHNTPQNTKKNNKAQTKKRSRAEIADVQIERTETGDLSDSSYQEESDGDNAMNSVEEEEDVNDEWTDAAETKEDDDRVADEVHKRYEMAKTLCAEIKPEMKEKSLLEQLLDQSDKYTEFMLAKSLSATDGRFYEKSDDKGLQRQQSRGLRRQQRGRDREEELLIKEADDELTGHQKGFWTRLSKQPATITGGVLKPYQLEGLNWLVHLYESGLNGILADEMGLGKTLQTISLLTYLKESRHINGPHLILAPKSTLGNWLNEIKRFCPSLRAYRFHGNKQDRREAKDRGDLNAINNKYDIFITSFELCIREQAVFRKFRFRYIIVDEAHRIKNEASKLSKIIRTFNTQFRLLLTGTPLQNNLRELWSLLNFLFPEMFSSSEEFDRIFDLTGAFDDSNKVLSSEDKTARNSRIVTRLHKILKPFLLRRLKSEVVVELPPKTELLLYVPLSKMQRSLYKDLLAKNVDFLTDTGGRVRLLNLAMQLRKACNHPYLFEGYEDKTLDPFGDHLITNCGKLILLDRLLQKLISSGSRILIFTQMTRMLDILEDYCRLRSFLYCRLDGSSLGEERERQIDEFNAPDSKQSIFLLSTRAGGLGINLATADTVIIYDSDFNPQVDLQAMDRAHRIGQKKHVNVYRLVHEHTIEEKIIERAMLKLRLDTAVIQQGRLSDKQTQQLSKTDLMRFIQFGADQIYKSASNDITELTDEDIDLILHRGEKRTMELSGRLESHVQEKTTNLLDFDFSSVANLYEFEGVDYNADKHAWAEMGVSALMEERNAKRKVRVAQEQLEEINRQHQIMSVSYGSGLSKNKNFKLPKMEEWQFFDRQRISEIHERELEIISSLSDGIIDEQKFSEREERNALLAEGFGDWSKKDFFNFVKSCECVGVNNVELIARDVGKSEESVRRYIKTFLSRYHELSDGEKWLKRVKAGEDVHVKRQQMEQILTNKLTSDGAWRRLSIKYAKSKTHFTDDEDRWLMNATLVVGYGNWEQLQTSINSDPHWMLNWFMRSRTPQDLGRRVEFLVRQIQKEESEETSTRSKAKEPGSVKRENGLRFYPSKDQIGYQLMINPPSATTTNKRKEATPKVRKSPGGRKKKDSVTETPKSEANSLVDNTPTIEDSQKTCNGLPLEVSPVIEDKESLNNISEPIIPNE